MHGCGRIGGRVLLALVAIFCGCLMLATRPAQAAGAIKLGVYSAAPAQPSALDDPRVLDDYIAMVGRKPDIVMDYSNLTDPLLTQTEINNVVSHGVTPMVTWQLYKSGWSGSTIPLGDIAA